MKRFLLRRRTELQLRLEAALTLLAFRLLGGVAIGGSSVAAPMYIAEIAPPESRGRLVAVSQLNIVIGILVAYLSNSLVEAAVGGPDSAAWRVMLGAPVVLALAFYLLTFGMPESPRWLIADGRRDEALGVLARVGADRPDATVAEIEQSLRGERAAAREPFFTRKYRRPILLALMVATFNQVSGINALIWFVVFGVMMLVQFVAVLVLLPETKGVSLEAIQRELGID